jgi:hypothetical protein
MVGSSPKATKWRFPPGNENGAGVIGPESYKPVVAW